MTREPSIAMSWPNGDFERDDQAKTLAVGVRDAGNELIVEAEIPGVDPKDVKVESRDDTLIISIRLPKAPDPQPRG